MLPSDHANDAGDAGAAPHNNPAAAKQEARNSGGGVPRGRSLVFKRVLSVKSTFALVSSLYCHVVCRWSNVPWLVCQELPEPAKAGCACEFQTRLANVVTQR